jgi:carbon-monoxide dehydrogenase small subunit
MKIQVTFALNGSTVSVETSATRRLIDLLREDLQLTGSKEGCGTGECGACTVLVDGEIRLACLMLAGQMGGRQVMTVEGLSASPSGAQLQRAFAEAGAVQCGYCIPGMEMAAFDLLSRPSTPSRDEIRSALSGNLCRCTGYVKIVDAVQQAAAACNAPTQEQPGEQNGSAS